MESNLHFLILEGGLNKQVIMKINVKLNNMKYRLDVYQTINIFYNSLDIEFVEENWDFYISIDEQSLTVKNDKANMEYVFENDLSHKENIKNAIFKYFTEYTSKIMPWGTLVGIRPSKIALTLMNEGKDDEDIRDYFHKHFYTRRDKAELCINIAKVERKLVNKDQNTISVYIGMPFCPTRCLYCSFTSNPIESCKSVIEPYLNSLKYEIEETAKYIKKKNLDIQCVYFGGGTPTSVNDEQFEKIMQDIYNSFVKENDIKEFTVECGRPDSITLNKLESMKKYKVDRISINPQTMNDDTLKLIGRRHSVSEVIDKFNLARECGLDNINMDIIIGLPGEGINHIIKTIDDIAKLSPDSITVHGMSVKRGSRLHENMINNVNLSVADQKELNLMYEKTVDLAERLNMKPYYMYRQKNMVGNMENVGYSVKEKEGLYNIQMIEEKQTIIACGADAITKIVFLDENRIERHGNVKDVREYINRVKEMVEKKINLLNTLY